MTEPTSDRERLAEAYLQRIWPSGTGTTFSKAQEAERNSAKFTASLAFKAGYQAALQQERGELGSASWHSTNEFAKQVSAHPTTGNIQHLAADEFPAETEEAGHCRHGFAIGYKVAIRSIRAAPAASAASDSDLIAFADWWNGINGETMTRDEVDDMVCDFRAQQKDTQDAN